jgi:PhzF family phenazine biosynthesis protein
MTLRDRPFQQADVFTATPYLGNPLAVVLDGTGLSDAQMQHFAAWTNLSETTFVLPPSHALADYRVRIFTPGAELPFAGHPTLGTCHAWLAAGGKPKQRGTIVQECAVGLVQIQINQTAPSSAGRLAFAAPPLKRSPVPPADLAAVASALGITPTQILAAQRLDNGPVWLGLLLDSPQTVLALQPDHTALKALGHKIGVIGISPGDEPAESPLISRSSREARAFSSNPTIEVRAFAAPVGIPEDPVTGSLNASLAQWLIADKLAPSRYTATQGTCLNRRGQVHIRQDDQGQVWVGGDVVTCVQGVVRL